MEKLCTICGGIFNDSVDTCPTDHKRLVLNAKRLIGESVADRYLVLEELHLDDFLLVLHAKDQRLGTDVIIKTLSVNPEQFPNRLNTLRAESAIYRKLENPRYPRLQDQGELRSGWPFFVYERIVGRTLEEIVVEEAPIAPAEAVDLASQVAGALAEAHAHGDVHGALHPGCIWVRPDPAGLLTVRVTDFGLTRIAGSQADLPTGRVVRRGRDEYTSPEQWRGEQATPQTDIYCLGLILYEMLAGKRPFDAPNRQELRNQVLGKRAPRIRDRSPSVPLPAALDDAVLQMMSRHRDDRPESMVAASRLLRDSLGSAHHNSALRAERNAELFHREAVAGLDLSWLVGPLDDVLPEREVLDVPAPSLPTKPLVAPPDVTRVDPEDPTDPLGALHVLDLARSAGLSSTSALLAAEDAEELDFADIDSAAQQLTTESGPLALPRREIPTPAVAASAEPIPAASMPAPPEAPPEFYAEPSALAQPQARVNYGPAIPVLTLGQGPVLLSSDEGDILPPRRDSTLGWVIENAPNDGRDRGNPRDPWHDDVDPEELLSAFDGSIPIDDRDSGFPWRVAAAVACAALVAGAGAAWFIKQTWRTDEPGAEVAGGAPAPSALATVVKPADPVFSAAPSTPPAAPLSRSLPAPTPALEVPANAEASGEQAAPPVPEPVVKLRDSLDLDEGMRSRAPFETRIAAPVLLAVRSTQAPRTKAEPAPAEVARVPEAKVKVARASSGKPPRVNSTDAASKAAEQRSASVKPVETRASGKKTAEVTPSDKQPIGKSSPFKRF